MHKNLQAAIALRLYGQEDIDKPFSIKPVHGGSVNAAYKITRGSDTFFVKVNNAAHHPLMFELEAKGLLALQQTNTFRIPHVLANGYADDDAFLVLEWIETGRQNTVSAENFGQKLAALHRNTHRLFGLADDNYIGSLFQSNGQMRHWAEFYMINRLDHQLELAFNAGLLGAVHIALFSKLYPKLESLIPHEVPALIHGDLWYGNALTDTLGNPVLIDPAVYYGHREMDLAMMKLFGGFDDAVFRAYHQSFPLERGWEQRIPLHQLYPLLVHINLFGSGYVQSLEGALNHFV